MRNNDKNRITHSTVECNGKLSAVADALYVIGGKWKLRVIIALSEGNKRFNDLQRTISGISARVLSNELKELELNGFVKRNVYTEPAVVIEYELTEYSDTLDPVLQSLINWGEMHRAKIKSDGKAEALIREASYAEAKPAEAHFIAQAEIA